MFFNKKDMLTIHLEILSLVQRLIGREGIRHQIHSVVQLGMSTTRVMLNVFHTGRGGLGEKVAQELLSDRPTQCMACCPLDASHELTTQWPIWRNTHTLNIMLDDYKEITSCVFFHNIEIQQFATLTHGMKLYWLL